jgi:hypothetical protein
MSRIFAFCLSLALLLLGAATLFAQQNQTPPAEPPAKLWIESYGIVLLCLVLGCALLLRPGTREESKV